LACGNNALARQHAVSAREIQEATGHRLGLATTLALMGSLDPDPGRAAELRRQAADMRRGVRFTHSPAGL
jgi:hypothetical protein